MNSVLGWGAMFAGILVIGAGCAARLNPRSCSQDLAGEACDNAELAGGPQQTTGDQGQAASDPEAAPADTDTDGSPPDTVIGAAGTYSQYIAFGDSFTSGYGLAGSNSNPCAQSQLAWPPQ